MKTNLQLIEKSVQREDGALDVVDIFPTIQGEGPFVGEPCVFVRLAGCNLQCPACDTDYTSERRLMTVRELLGNVMAEMPPNADLVVLTGGEPMRQCLGPFVSAVVEEGNRVQIETNGTLWDSSLEGNSEWNLGDLTIVCSPKAGLNREVVNLIDCYKYVLSADAVDPEDGLPTSVLGTGVRPARPADFTVGSEKVYLQPCDDGDPVKNKANLDAVVASCMKFGYLLCIQVHKVVGLP